MNDLSNGLRTYRPDLSHYVFSNEVIRSSVLSWVEGVRSGSASRALLLTGDSGLGKTTLAYAVSKELGVDPKDISEINCGNTRTLDDARELINRMSMMPMNGPFRVLLLDECHQLVANAQSAFLTPIEGLPPTTLLIACTSNPELLLYPFRSRFYEIKLGAYGENEILDIITQLPIEIPPSVQVQIAQFANGNARRAIDLVERNLAGANNEITETMAQELQKELQSVESFFEALLTNDKKLMFLQTAYITTQNKQFFFDRMYRLLEGTWSILSDLKPALSASDKSLVTKILSSRSGDSALNASSIAKIHWDLLSIQDKPPSYLKSWIMNRR